MPIETEEFSKQMVYGVALTGFTTIIGSFLFTYVL